MARTSSALGLVSLAVALVGAALTACAPDGDASALTNGDGRFHSAESNQTDGTNAKGANTSNGNAPADGALPNISAKEYFAKNVHGTLSQTCSGCHSQGGAGPMWVVATDVEKSYALMFQRGYVSRTSTILRKGSHASGGAPALTKDQNVVFSTWVELELKERGDKAPPSVLEKVGSCLDKGKFDAIKFGTLITVTRNANNNPGKQTENANECTGCAPTQCSTCHSSDPGTGFLMAIGNDILPADHTFTESKSTMPPYLQKYFGLDTNGDPIASNAIKQKSDATVKAPAYSHPMFVLTPTMEEAINVFVNDAISKYKSGACGK